MSTDTAVADAGIHEGDHDDHDHEDHGLTFQNAIKIAIFLALVTLVEVLTYFWDFGDVAVPLLIVLMVIKFGVVVAYFMHLRFENVLFTALFVAGLVLAVAVYLAMLTAFEFWS
jgi:cytochrome c oxidase subunit 4